MPPPFLYASSIRRAVWRTRSPAPFFYAGARALLVSHWAVDSDAAVLLTTRTFAELKANTARGGAQARDAGCHAGQGKTCGCPSIILGAFRDRRRGCSAVRSIGVQSHTCGASARGPLWVQIRPPQSYPEGLLGTSVDPQIPDAIAAAARYGRSVPEHRSGPRLHCSKRERLQSSQFGLSWTVFPPTMVITETMSRNPVSSIVSGSAVKTARSASLPGSSEPFLPSSKVR